MTCTTFSFFFLTIQAIIRCHRPGRVGVRVNNTDRAALTSFSERVGTRCFTAVRQQNGFRLNLDFLFAWVHDSCRGTSLPSLLSPFHVWAFHYRCLLSPPSLPQSLPTHKTVGKKRVGELNVEENKAPHSKWILKADVVGGFSTVTQF